MLLIMTSRPQNIASHVSTPSSNVFILSIKWSGLSNLSSRESISQESTLQLKLQKESKTYDVYSMVFSLPTPPLICLEVRKNLTAPLSSKSVCSVQMVLTFDNDRT